MKKQAKFRIEEPERKGKYKPDLWLENILFNANLALEPLEKKLISKLSCVFIPYISLCYAPRSGSTLLSQIIAFSGEFNYISNVMARFWLAPYIGGLLEKSLGIKRRYFNYDTITNKYGVTRNIYEPHEFGFFWNRWIKPFELYRKTRKINEDIKLFKMEMNAIASLSNKPLFFKNGTSSMNPDILHEILNDVYFIILKRDPLFIAQSIFKARINIYGNPNVWWSTKPSNFNEICKEYKDPYNQIALQIKYIYKDIEERTSKIKDRCIELYYEDLCKAPVFYTEKILNCVGYTQCNDLKSLIPEKFEIHNKIEISKKDFELLREAIRRHDVII